MTPITHLYLRPLRRPTTTGDSVGPQDSGLSRLPGEPARRGQRCAIVAVMTGRPAIWLRAAMGGSHATVPAPDRSPVLWAAVTGWSGAEQPVPLITGGSHVAITASFREHCALERVHGVTDRHLTGDVYATAVPEQSGAARTGEGITVSGPDRLALVNGQRPRSDGPGGMVGAVTTIGCAGFRHDTHIERMVSLQGDVTGTIGAGRDARPTPSLIESTVAANWRMPIWAREETAMPATACTEDAMEAMHDHNDATLVFIATVRRSMADRKITDDEWRQIEAYADRTVTTKNRVHLAVERTHYGFTMAMAYLRVGKKTPKVLRKDRELRAGIISLEERIAERDGAPLPAA